MPGASRFRRASLLASSCLRWRMTASASAPGRPRALACRTHASGWPRCTVTPRGSRSRPLHREGRGWCCDSRAPRTAMRTIRASIVDDEPLARRGIRQLLAPHADVTVAGEAGDGHEAVALVRDVQPDLLFLDIQMPEID